MRMTAVVACVPLLAGVLAGALEAQTGTDGRLPGEGGQGVQVMVLPPAAYAPLRYVLSDPAYVAAFIVYPGAGVRLLYPTVNVPEQLQDAGYHTDRLYGDSFDNDFYHAVLGPILPGPSYLYVVVSRHPLDVARYVNRPMHLASAVGVQASRSFYNNVAFDALLNNAISLGDDDSWDSDVYMLDAGGGSGGSVADANRAVQYTYLACADGSTRVVPINYPFAGCPGQVRLRVSPQALRQLQPTNASADASASRQLQQGQLARRASDGSTVLPTIIGPHITDAQRRTAVAEEAASQRVMFTAANGDPQVAQRADESASQTHVEVFESPERIRDRDGRGGMRGEHSAEQREQVRQRQQNVESAGSPQLAPNPRLSPNPGFAPSSRAGSAHMEAEAPRMSAPVAAPVARSTQSSAGGSQAHAGQNQ
ncbi:MAG TPA: hypothetical protein VII66_08250 [Gemmatimonadaceae bacterium]